MLSYGAFMLVFALTVQDGLRASPLRSGLAILPMAVAFFAGSLFTPRAIARLGARKTVAVGATVDGIGLRGLILIVRGGWPHVGLLTLAPALAVAGVGQALVFGSLFSDSCSPTYRSITPVSAEACSSPSNKAALPSASPR